MLRLMIALIAPAVLAAGSASAGLKFCNKTGNKAIVAIGYNDAGTWTSEGWWHVPANECKTVVGGDLSKKFYYFRAKADGSTWGNQKYFFCTSSAEFTIPGDENCDSRGYERAEFNQIDVGRNASFTMNLTSSAPAKKKAAPAAAPKRPAAPAPAPRASGPAPGTYGEPYTVAGLLSHCDVYDVTLGCEIHGNGYRYVANSGDHTAQNLLEQMLDLPVNTPITITGDMITYSGNLAQVTIRSYELEGHDPYGSYRSAMQGFFRSIDDSSYEVLINGNVFEEMYDGIPTDTSMMEFASNCPGFPGDGPAVNLKGYSNPDEDRCMFLSLDGGFIELFPAGGMRPVTFLKVN